MLLVDAAVQHDIRIGANDPQIQMAEDTASALASGGQPTSLLPSGPVDISKSLAPYLIVYDGRGQILASSASLHGAQPVLSEGVFADVAKHGEQRFTWQPAPGVRQAVVVARYGGANAGFVLAGRSIREVELRGDDLNAEVIVAWAVSLAGTFVVLSVVLVLLGWSPFRPSREAA